MVSFYACGIIVLMARIINIVSNDAVSGGKLFFEIATRLSKFKKICVFDMNFGFNQVVYLFDKYPRFDLKDFLIGDKRFEEVIGACGKNLYLIKSNNVFFDYLEYVKDIKRIIKKYEVEFDYIFIVGFLCDVKSLDFNCSISTEVLMVIDNSIQSLFYAHNIIKKCSEYKQIINIKILLNNHKIIGEISGISLSKEKIKQVLKTEILFALGSVVINKKIRNKELDLLVSAIDKNTEIEYNYKKHYKGLREFVRRKIYKKFEGS